MAFENILEGRFNFLLPRFDNVSNTHQDITSRCCCVLTVRFGAVSTFDQDLKWYKYSRVRIIVLGIFAKVEIRRSRKKFRRFKGNCKVAYQDPSVLTQSSQERLNLWVGIFVLSIGHCPITGHLKRTD